MTQLELELEDLLNHHGVENESDTPDFILAEYLTGCLKVYQETVKKRDKWYDFEPWARNTGVLDGTT